MTEEFSAIEGIIDDIIDCGDIELDPAPNGLGLKAHLGELHVDKESNGSIYRFFVQFYSEKTVPLKPKDEMLGYTLADMHTTAGVTVLDVEEQTDPPQYIGETYEIDDFIKEFIFNQNIKTKILHLMDDLDTRATPSEDWFEHVSSLYHDRVPGVEWITGLKRVN